jgi:hypothetical protein
MKSYRILAYATSEALTTAIEDVIANISIPMDEKLLSLSIAIQTDREDVIDILIRNRYLDNENDMRRAIKLAYMVNDVEMFALVFTVYQGSMDYIEMMVNEHFVNLRTPILAYLLKQGLIPTSARLKTSFLIADSYFSYDYNLLEFNRWISSIKLLLAYGARLTEPLDLQSEGLMELQKEALNSDLY